MEVLNKLVLSSVPKNIKCLLDVGCGSGWLGREVKKRSNCYVLGITKSEKDMALASKFLDEVIICDLNNFDSSQLGKFDCIVCSHILEHLYQPQELLRRLRNNLTSDGVLIVALPNILYWKQRWEFFRGRFRYADSGIIDSDHFRFFDWETAHKLLEQSGYKIIESITEGNFPLPVIRKFLPLVICSQLDRFAVKYFPGFFGFQFILTAHIRYENINDQ